MIDGPRVTALLQLIEALRGIRDLLAIFPADADLITIRTDLVKQIRTLAS
jgi:hypothetical protein